MPQTTQHSLVHVLLLWITILSIAQISFIILFFTTGRLSHNAEAPAGPMQLQANYTPSPPSQQVLGKMLHLQAKEVNRNIQWVAVNEDLSLVSVKEQGGKVLTIKKDGYFFLNFQVTLDSCNATQDTVSLKKNNKYILLQGRFDTDKCSTGFLSKVEEMSAADTLEVTINVTKYRAIDEHRTHLDIIYMP